MCLQPDRARGAYSAPQTPYVDLGKGNRRGRIKRDREGKGTEWKRKEGMDREKGRDEN